MMFGKRYFGLHGVQLQIAIGVLAGLDFLLFGYDQGVMGGLLTLPSFVSADRELKSSNINCLPDQGPNFPSDRYADGR